MRPSEFWKGVKKGYENADEYMLLQIRLKGGAVHTDVRNVCTLCHHQFVDAIKDCDDLIEKAEILELGGKVTEFVENLNDQSVKAVD